MAKKAKPKRRGRPCEGRNFRVGLYLTELEYRHLKMLSKLTTDGMSTILRAGLSDFFRNSITGQPAGVLWRPFHEAFLRWTVVEARRRTQGLPPTKGLPKGVESFVQDCIGFLNQQQKEADQQFAEPFDESPDREVVIVACHLEPLAERGFSPDTNAARQALRARRLGVMVTNPSLTPK